jgi:hypothetical protein
MDLKNEPFKLPYGLKSNAEYSHPMADVMVLMIWLDMSIKVLKNINICIGYSIATLWP